MKIDGKVFSQMCVSGANALDNNQATINALNVFPVPDGDTGINMSLTMSSVQDLDSFDGTTFRLCAYFLSKFDFFDFPAVYEKITVEDIYEFLQRVVTPERCSLCVINPKEQE